MVRLELNSCPKYVERRKFLFLFFQLALFVFLCSKSIQFCQSVGELLFWGFFWWFGDFLHLDCFGLGWVFFVGVFVVFLYVVGFFWGGVVCLFVWGLFWVDCLGLFGSVCNLTYLVQLKGSNECQ